MKQRRRRAPVSRSAGAFAALLDRRDFERAALCLLVAAARALREAPPESIDELLSLLAGEDARDEA